MKYPQFVYSFLLLLVFGGCCKLDTSPLRLTATDRELLANDIGDTLRFRDMSNDSVYVFVVESIEISIEEDFGGISETVGKAGCGRAIKPIEVGKVNYTSNQGLYALARRINALDFVSTFRTQKDTIGIGLIIQDNNSEFEYVKFHNTLSVRNKTYNQVYELFRQDPLNSNKFTRVLIETKRGLVYLEDTFFTNKIFERE